MTENLLTVKVSNFEEVVVIAIVGGLPRVVHGKAYTHPFLMIDTREPKHTIVYDCDSQIIMDILGPNRNKGSFDKLFEFVVHQDTGETLRHYRMGLSGLDEEQRLEPEGNWEFRQE